MAETSTKRGVPRALLSDRQRATVAPAASIPRIQFSTGVGRALSNFSNDLFNTSQRIAGQLDEQARAEGAVEGATAGATGDLELQDYTTIRGRAYNQAGIQTFVSTLETQAITATAALRQQHANNPAALEVALKDYHAGVASRISEIDPGAAVAYRQRSTIRSLPAVEAAKDTAFKLTRDQADAMLISSQVALNAELKTHSADLFSENPERSRAAAQAVGLVSQEVMRVYDAVDPATGRPLYSPVERAKAKAHLQETIFKGATLSWFADQDNKVAAYLDFTSGDFKIELGIDPASVPIIDATTGKIRDKPLAPDVTKKMSAAVAAMGPGIGIMVTSGGQDPIGTPGGQRTGSTRHDHGDAADIVLMRDGQPVTPEEDPALYMQFFENAAAAGFTGIGHYGGFVHVGGGSEAAWGPDKTSRTLDPFFAEAIRRGRENPMDINGGTTKIDANSAMSPAALKALESEMRSQISFANEQADRAERQEEKELQAAQDKTSFDLSMSLYMGGQEVAGVEMPPLTPERVMLGVELQEISPQMGEAFLKALSTDAPTQSDLAVYNEALQRLDAGEDVTQFVLDNRGNLSASHAAKLIEKNRQAIDDPEETKMTEAQRTYEAMLRETLVPEGWQAFMDQGAGMRGYNALDEYQKRVVEEGEDPDAVSREILERSRASAESSRNVKLQRMLRPRFSVEGQDIGHIDVAASFDALDNAFDQGRISENSYIRQLQLLEQWDTIQKEGR